jgi:hypothetical protein
MEQHRHDPMGRFIGRPFMPWTAYPWRPMDNREKLAAWSVKWYAQFDPLRLATDTRPRVTSPGRKPSAAPVGGGAAGTPEAML